MNVPKNLNLVEHMPVREMMNTNFKPLLPGDTLRTVLEYYQDNKVNLLPVLDAHRKLVGVFPKKRLFRALLEGADIDAPCEVFMIKNPVCISADLSYDEFSLVSRVRKSRVDTVIVLDGDEVVGTMGTAEYLIASQNLVTASSALLESLFRVNQEGIVIVDTDERIIKANPAAERMFNLNVSDVLGKKMGFVFPEVEFQDRFSGIYKRTVRSLPVMINCTPIVENDVPIGASYAFRDLSELEKIAHELEIVRTLQTTINGVLNSSSDGVFVSDTSGAIKYVNNKACNLFSKTFDQITDQPVQRLFKTDTPFRVARSGSVEVDNCDINGKKCLVSHAPLKNSERDEITGIVSTVYLNDNAIAEELFRKWSFLNQEMEYYREKLEKRDGVRSSFDNIIAHDVGFSKIKQDAQRIARSSSTVLLTGESGVGKGMFARGIHDFSPRAEHPFVIVNCVSIPETLFESELFGYAPGSFTGALKSGKPGFFERAQHGTVFLDEIGDIPLSTQVKLLQVLQEKEFIRVGGSSKQNVDVRIIAATNRNLMEAVANKTFREDLYYRLNVIEFHIPPLRERTDDIIPLAESFIQKSNHILGTKITGLDRRARTALLEHPWPGNIRELENAIERAANYVWEGDIGVDDLPSQISLQSNASYSQIHASYHSAHVNFEREMLMDALRRAKGNKSAAAKLLNLSRSAFYERLSKYGVTRAE
ncbi:MAG: sigma 54-interacting transcriptional regulator [Clostridiales Family XIII bacterium]|jgi:transcriptional regulator with PAS, ATPase and Fis domain|nr:sigma 54-interacting transcriptional regulator [Clostridiales Family XIII bacterium]